MNNFYLANASSINLNFLVYIQNLYENYNRSTEIKNIFPWLPLDRDSLLKESELKIKSKELWSIIFNFNDLYENDIDYWINYKFSFNDLFKDNPAGIEAYRVVKRSFESWYWGIGYKICTTIFSDSLIPDYYDNLVKMAKEKNLKLKDIKFYLQVIYDIPPREWELKNKNMIVISPQIQLPAVEEILHICSTY